MPHKIEITSPEIDVISGTSAKTGKPYEIRKQEGFFFKGAGEKYPKPFEVMLPKGHAGYAPGMYKLRDDAINIDRNGRLAVTPELVPLEAASTIPLGKAGTGAAK